MWLAAIKAVWVLELGVLALRSPWGGSAQLCQFKKNWTLRLQATLWGSMFARPVGCSQ